MRALLDVNVLIALLDSDHLHHGRARGWLKENIKHGWASCPLTQNGCIRIMSQTGYPNALPAAAVAERLAAAIATNHHVFWPDTVSMLDAGRVTWNAVLGSRQVTDVYLLALAVALLNYTRDHGGEVLIAPTDVILDVERALVLQPDLLYVGPAGPARVGDRVEGPPNLVVEVLSPNPRIGRLAEKVDWYARYGVEEIWLFHQFIYAVDVLTCGGGRVVNSARFQLTAPIQSLVLPASRKTTASICGI